MKLKWIVTAGAIAGAALAARRRRQQKSIADGERWATATDPVTPFGHL